MTDIGFEPDRVRAWLATPVGARVADSNPALQRTADVVLDAMMAAGTDPLLKVNLLVKVLAMVIGGMAKDHEPAEIAQLCEYLGPSVQLEAREFLRRLRHDIRDARPHA